MLWPPETTDCKEVCVGSRKEPSAGTAEAEPGSWTPGHLMLKLQRGPLCDQQDALVAAHAAPQVCFSSNLPTVLRPLSVDAVSAVAEII